MTVRRYATPLVFKQALEQRLEASSTTGTDFGRRRQRLGRPGSGHHHRRSSPADRAMQL